MPRTEPTPHRTIFPSKPAVTAPMAEAIAFIPARYASTRFPGKVLADRTGCPMIQHVVEQVRQARTIDRIVVATDDPRIAAAVARFKCESVLTHDDHPNGTSRIAEAIRHLERDGTSGLPPIIVNVQGDEPEIEPPVIDLLVDGIRSDLEASMATLASEFAPHEDPADPDIVKVVVNQHNRAMYFSRSLIPFCREPAPRIAPLKHAGIYAYRRQFLAKYIALPPTPLEQSEGLEQLRAIEHGHAIAVIKTQIRHHGIDTPQQYEAFVQRLATTETRISKPPSEAQA